MKSKQFSDIKTMIEQDLATSRQLLALLEEETNSTQSRDYQNLSRLLEEKTPLLEQLKQNADLRSQWLSSLNQAANEQNWSELLGSLDGISLQAQWQEVKKTIEHCQKINQINGTLINRGVTSHTRLLQLMRGNLQQPDLYNAKGNKRISSSYGTVARA